MDSKGLGCILDIAIFISMILMPPAASQLSPTNYRMEFPEEQDPGTVVANLPQMFNVRFNDLHGRYFEILGQRLKVGKKLVKSDGKWLTIDRYSGVIAVNEPLDRETECGDDSELDCVLMLQTAMLPQNHFRLQSFEFVVTDINDHSPKFPPRVIANGLLQLNVTEDTPALSAINIDQFMATDEDLNDNAAIHYSVVRNKYFTVNEYEDDTRVRHLELVIQSALDYEDIPVFDLDLIATDEGAPLERSTQVSLRITIIDVNDNPPIFDETVYDMQLRENMPSGQIIATVHATDIDSGRFGEVRYYVPRTGNSVFAHRFVNVNPISGEVTLRISPDRERSKKVKVIIAAEDSRGLPGKKIGRALLVIHITDVNDNAPRIDVNMIIKGPEASAYVSENAELGTYIAHVSATDADHGDAGRVLLSIDSIQSLKNESISESIRTRNDLSRSNYFVMKDKLISTNRRLDREKEDKYLIQIKACDRGIQPRCSFKNVKVVILDTNDHSPKFLSTNHVITLSENMHVGNVIDSVKATDLDSTGMPALCLSQTGEFENSKNGEVRYSLTGGGSVFAIDSLTGSIKLVGILDHEARSLWKIVVTALDLGNPARKSNLTITIKVTDVNDHRPVFVKPNKTNTTLYATILDDQTIIRMKTVDGDAGDNAEVWYSIELEDGSVNAQKFVIDPVTGILRFNITNRLTDLLGEHSLVIKAMDKGYPPLGSTIPIIIKVIDLPLSSVIPDYEENDEEQKNTKITAVVLSSLASATMILLIILICIVVKCRKEKKEFRIYNFRDAENIGLRGDGMYCTSTTNIRQWEEGGSVSTAHATLGRGEPIRPFRRNTRDEHNKPSKKTILEEQLDEELIFTTFSRSGKEPEDDLSSNKTPSLHVGDGDSGRGDSDRETDSCVGDKQHISQPVRRQMKYRYIADMGPRCTPSCRKYGHSDDCWMPIVAGLDHTEENERFSSYQHSQRTGNSVYNSSGGLISRNSCLDFISNGDPGGLETISETQPLRVVLDFAKSVLHTCGDQEGNLEHLPLCKINTNSLCNVGGTGKHLNSTSVGLLNDFDRSQWTLQSQFHTITPHMQQEPCCGSSSLERSEDSRSFPVGNNGNYQPTRRNEQSPEIARPQRGFKLSNKQLTTDDLHTRNDSLKWAKPNVFEFRRKASLQKNSLNSPDYREDSDDAITDSENITRRRHVCVNKYDENTSLTNETLR